MTTRDPDDILALMQSRRSTPLTDEQVRKVVQSLVNLNAQIPGAMTERQEERLKQRFPDIVPTWKPLALMPRPRPKKRASNRV